MSKKNMRKILLSDIKNTETSLAVTAEIASKNRGALSGITVLHINHTLTDVFSFNNLLISMGAEVIFVGVPYNNNNTEELAYENHLSIRQGTVFTPHKNGKINLEIDPDPDYIKIILKQISEIVGKLVSQKSRTIIVQDGGYTAFLDARNSSINSLVDSGLLIGMVEQTTSGTKLLFDSRAESLNGLRYPIISIAKSELKSAIETQFIGESIFQACQLAYKRMGSFLKFKTVIVGGYGVIGRSLAWLMRGSGIYVIIKEIDPILSQLARREGFQCITKLDRTSFEESTLYLGCTGTESFDISDLVTFLSSNSVEYSLASGSSKRVEFWPLIRSAELTWSTNNESFLADMQQAKEFVNMKVSEINTGIEYEFFNESGYSKKIKLLGGGFPINFIDPDGDGIPDRAIDLTQSALISAIIELAKDPTKLPNDRITFYKNNGLLGDVVIDENSILQRWLKLNNIELSASYPLESFNQHPLREYLIKKRFS